MSDRTALIIVALIAVVLGCTRLFFGPDAFMLVLLGIVAVGGVIGVGVGLAWLLSKGGPGY